MNNFTLVWAQTIHTMPKKKENGPKYGNLLTVFNNNITFVDTYGSWLGQQILNGCINCQILFRSNYVIVVSLLGGLNPLVLLLLLLVLLSPIASTKWANNNILMMIMMIILFGWGVKSQSFRFTNFMVNCKGLSCNSVQSSLCKLILYPLRLKAKPNQTQSKRE